MAAQTVLATDTLAQARSLRQNGQLHQAEELLDRWCAAHPTDVNAFWLRAQNEFWRKNFRKTSHYYNRAIALDPNNLYLKLDFAETELAMGKFNQAKKRLLNLPKNDQKDPQFKLVFAKYHYWSGDPAAAEKLASAAKNSGSENAAALLHEIKLMQSPWALAGVQYANDSQPLESYEPSVEAGFFSTKWLNLHVFAASQRFLLDTAALFANRVEIGNQFHVPKTRSIIGLSAGLFHLEDQATKVTAQLEWTQPLAAGLQTHAWAAQTPYLHTLSSLDTTIFVHQFSGDLEWKEPHGFWAKMGAEASVFEDKNRVATYWGWAMTPALKLGPISARAGYAYSYSDAKESRFLAVKTLDQILNPWDSTAQIEGVYKPYFTPEKMETHALLFVLECRVAKHITLTINGKCGFSAKAQNPYLYLENSATDAVFVQRGFQETGFTPLEVGARLGIQFTERLSLEANYAFTRNFFYEIHTAGVRLKMVF